MKLPNLFRRNAIPAPPRASAPAPRTISRAYVNDALAEMDRIYHAKGAEAACLFIRVALVECPKATGPEIERVVERMREACQHEWVTTTNRHLQGRMLCVKCASLKSE